MLHFSLVLAAAFSADTDNVWMWLFLNLKGDAAITWQGEEEITKAMWPIDTQWGAQERREELVALREQVSLEQAHHAYAEVMQEAAKVLAKHNAYMQGRSTPRASDYTNARPQVLKSFREVLVDSSLVKHPMHRIDVALAAELVLMGVQSDFNECYSESCAARDNEAYMYGND